MALPSRWWSDLSTRQFAEADLERAVALLPVAAVEQHGPHLPVGVDAAINAGIIAAALSIMPDDLDVLVLPAVPFGKSDEHIAYPGTLTISFETLHRLWFEIAESARRAGCRRIVLFNSHGGQIPLVETVCRDIRLRLGMLAVGCLWLRTVKLDDLFSAHELRHGIHGGESETSAMLHLRPDLVDMTRAADFESLSVEIERRGAMLTPDGDVCFGWQTQDLQPSGACGNAAAADGRRGAEMIERAARALVRLLREVAEFPLERLSRAPQWRLDP